MEKYWIIWNDTLPFKGYKAMALWPWIFVRNGVRFTMCDRNHERIHLRQQLEMLVSGAAVAAILAITGCGWWSLLALGMFFWWYGLECVVRLMIYRSGKMAYGNIAFEQEAIMNEHDFCYLKHRRPSAWLKYLSRKTYRQ